MAGDVFGLVGQVIDNRFRVDAFVGEGGFGTVYRGHHLSFEHPIAIKCLKVPAHFSPQGQRTFFAKFLDEGRVLSKLSHPAIVRVFDLGVTQARGRQVPYLILEWLEGVPLSDFIVSRRSSGAPPLDEREAIGMLRPVVDALAMAHAQGITHGDVKPENVFHTPGGKGARSKLLEFGIAKAMQEGEDATRMAGNTASSFSAFSTPYAAPEQFQPSRFGASGSWTDVHALGLVLTEMTSGVSPYRSRLVAEQFIAATDPVRPTPRALGANVSDAFQALVGRALALDPRERFPHAGALLDALDAIPGARASMVSAPMMRISSPDTRARASGTMVASGDSNPFAALSGPAERLSSGPRIPSLPSATARGRTKKSFPWGLLIGGLVAVALIVSVVAIAPWEKKKKKKKASRDDDDDDDVRSNRPVASAPASASAPPVLSAPPPSDGASAYLATSSSVFVIDGAGKVTTRGASGIQLLEAERDGRVYFVDFEGIGRFEGNEMKRLASSPPRMPEHIEIGKGGVLLSVDSKGLAKYDGTAWSEISIKGLGDSDGSTQLRDVAIDDAGTIYVANGTGVWRKTASSTTWEEAPGSIISQRMELGAGSELWVIDPLGFRRISGFATEQLYDHEQPQSAFVLHRDLKPDGTWLMVDADSVGSTIKLSAITVGKGRSIVDKWAPGPDMTDADAVAVDTQARAWIAAKNGPIYVFVPKAPPKIIKYPQASAEPIDQIAVIGKGPASIPGSF